MPSTPLGKIGTTDEENDMTDVLCCCNPDNQVGTIDHDAGVKAGLELREWEDDAGNTGLAFSSHGADLDKIPGFVRGGRKGGRKTWRKRAGA